MFMSASETKWLREIAFASAYAQIIAHCLRRGDIPRPPVSSAEVAVIRYEYPKLLAEWLPLLLTDTPFRRAAEEFVTEVGSPY